jgi:uncharacterized membrane protein YGL010W
MDFVWLRRARRSVSSFKLDVQTRLEKIQHVHRCVLVVSLLNVNITHAYANNATVSTGIDLVATWQLQTCDHGKYCCRAINDTKSCCNDSTAPKVTTTFSATLQLQTSTPTSTSTATSEPVDVAATAVSTGTPFEATVTPLVNTCQKEKRQTAIVGGTIGSLFGAIIIALAATIFWMYNREKRQRKLKEHYEEQFQQTNAYRKALASSAGSVRGSVLMEEFKTKSSGPD